MPDIDPWQYGTAQQIATATGCSQSAIATNWPLLAQELANRGIWTQDDVIAALGTVTVETAHTFESIHEYGTPADWASYDGGPAFAGRSFGQLTHKYNYDACGRDIGIDLVTDPDVVLDPAIGAKTFAWFYATHGVPSKDGSHYYTCQELADEPDYYWFRVAWSGASRGADTMLDVRNGVLANGVPPSGERLYIADVPESIVLQYPEDWTCSVHATAAVTYALEMAAGGPHVPYETVYNWMVPSICDASVGLHAADGHELVALLNSKGYRASASYPASLAEAQSKAGRAPLLLGGASWYHWVMVKGVEADGTLVLENPAPGYKGISGELRDSWPSLGPMTLITVELADAPVPVPTPTPPADQSVLVAELQAQVAALTRQRDGLVVTVSDIADRLGDQIIGYAEAIKSTVGQMEAERTEAVGARP